VNCIVDPEHVPPTTDAVAAEFNGAPTTPTASHAFFVENDSDEQFPKMSLADFTA
jgi:hypothetical protein